MMHKNYKILETLDIQKEIYSDSNVRTYSATLRDTMENVLLRVYKDCVDLKNIPHVINSNEVNSLSGVLKVKNIQSYNNTLYVVHECKDYVPVSIVLNSQEDSSDEHPKLDQNTFFYIFFLGMLHLIKNNEFLGKILDLLEPEHIWIDSEFNIKICWCSFVMDKQSYFNNTIYNLNVNTEKGIYNLINLNSKHLKKRVYKHHFNSDDNINYSSKFENSEKESKKNSIIESQTTTEEPSKVKFLKDSSYGKQVNFMTNDFNIASWGLNLKEDATLENYDKEGLRRSGNKKVCLQYKVKSEEEVKVSLDWTNLKILLYKVLFKTNDVNINLSEFYSQKLLENINVESEEENALQTCVKKDKAEFDGLFGILNCLVGKLSDEKKNRLKMIICDNLNMGKKSSGSSPAPLLPTIKTLDVEGDTLNIIEDIFTEKGFNMSGYSTKIYKKGRFHIYEAVPAKNDMLTRKKDVNNLLRVIDIQNKQINMIYEILKNKGKIENLIDDQLKTLFIEATNLLDEIDK